jgi:hypothetical protein
MVIKDLQLHLYQVGDRWMGCRWDAWRYTQKTNYKHP